MGVAVVQHTIKKESKPAIFHQFLCKQSKFNTTGSTSISKGNEASQGFLS
jgi:hypothetical protein